MFLFFYKVVVNLKHPVSTVVQDTDSDFYASITYTTRSVLIKQKKRFLLLANLEQGAILTQGDKNI